jgi:methyl-accepting chemotaxis protein
MNELMGLRLRGTRMVAILGWSCTALLAFLGLVWPLYSPWLAVLISAALNVLPTLSAMSKRYDLSVASIFGLNAAIQPALLVFMLDSHPWQMEGHMYFFVGLAALTLLCDWRPIAIAVGIIAAHHLLLSYIAPEWVFIGSGDLPRVMVHAIAVSMVFGLLGPVMVHMGRVIMAQAEARDRSDELARSAQEALAAATRAEESADEERQKRIDAERRANADARRSELLELAGSFETSVASIVQSVGAAAEQLEKAARDMHQFANEAGKQSASAAQEAESTSRSVVEVSARVSELSKSIASIAANAEQQAQLGEAARNSSATGEVVIRELAERTGNIAGFVSLIDSVAAQTNMLALNATIEAARAGDAGRGFGVVAAEVKTLAESARGASAQINEVVDHMGSSAEEAQHAVTEIAGAMRQIAESAALMRSEIGDQRHVASVIEGNAADSASSADQIARRIGEVARSAGEAMSLSNEVQASAAGLAKVAHGLQQATGQFLSKLRAA